jgi:hypothetical protein
MHGLTVVFRWLSPYMVSVGWHWNYVHTTFFRQHWQHYKAIRTKRSKEYIWNRIRFQLNVAEHINRYPIRYCGSLRERVIGLFPCDDVTTAASRDVAWGVICTFISEILGDKSHTFLISVQDALSLWARLSHCCHDWLQAKNNEVGGVSNIKTQKLCLTISQSFSRFLKCKTPQHWESLKISEEKSAKHVSVNKSFTWAVLLYSDVTSFNQCLIFNTGPSALFFITLFFTISGN